MRKILILTNSLDGLYSFRRELIDQLIGNEYKVIISAPSGNKEEYFKSMGCDVIETKLNRRSKNPFNDIKLLFFYLHTIRRISPDVVLTYTIKPNIYGGIACRYTKTPHIANITGLGTSIENQGILRKISLILYRIGLKDSRKIFFQNSSNLKVFEEEKIVKKGYLLPGSGVNLEYYTYEEYPNETETLRILFIGRIMKAKGVDELFVAIEKLKDIEPRAEFHFVGSFEENYDVKINELVTRKAIYYHGRQDDIYPYIKNCHALINPSHHEGMSNVLLEAAAIGRPVLASNIPGCRETFDEGVTGFGFESKNAENLINTIIKFIKLSYEEKKNMGLAGRQKVEQEFDRTIVVDSYLQEIVNIVDMRSS